jgi:hypothetical protein
LRHRMLRLQTTYRTVIIYAKGLTLRFVVFRVVGRGIKQNNNKPGL